jgi:hypothetical protein
MPSGLEDRQYWVHTLYRIAHPMLNALSQEQLKATMPVEVAHSLDRRNSAHLEAFGRTLAGIAPWLEADGLDAAEAAQRDDIARLAQVSLRIICDPASPDYANFSVDPPPVMNASYVAHGILRAPRVLWQDIEPETRGLVVAAMKRARRVRPHYTNWLLFSAMVETFLHWTGGQGDLAWVDYVVRRYDSWYTGDGWYGDGPFFHWDYYNSYVIHPMLLDIARTLRGVAPKWDRRAERFLRRAQRYAAIQERLIAPDGSFPVIGRSITYRTGVFQLLAQLTLQETLPAGLAPAQVRGGLTAAIHRVLDAEGTFDAGGWLTLGLSGHQPSLAERYMSTGSMYLCTLAFLPLGLPPAHPFWSGEPLNGTWQRVWSGEAIPADQAVDERGPLQLTRLQSVFRLRWILRILRWRARDWLGR